MTGWVEYLLRIEHMLIMVAVSALIGLARSLWPGLSGNPVWVRALPALPIAACSVAVWVPGLTDGTPAERVLLGIVLGSVCGHAHKLTKQGVFGNDKRIRDHPQRL
jgi:hypothetical protein